jgi:hypothetical protein
MAARHFRAHDSPALETHHGDLGRHDTRAQLRRRRFIGQHARANRKGSIIAHSYSSLGIQTMLMNGKPVGEMKPARRSRARSIRP